MTLAKTTGINGSWVILITLSFILSGCTASSFNAMKKDSRYKQQEYLVNENYQSLYKRALNISKECHEHGAITAAQIADGELYSDLQKAELSIYLMGGLGRSVYHGASFDAIDAHHTKMIIYSRWGGEWFELFEKQYTGKCNTCDCKI